MKSKRIITLCICFILIFTFCLPVSAVSATDSFRHWDLVNGNKKAVYSKDVYKASAVISSRSLGLDTSILIKDIATDKQGILYVLLDDSRVVVADEDYKFIREISVTDEENQPIDYVGAGGIYVSDEDELYICDSNNGRVIICDLSGKYKAEISSPESPVLPEDFSFVPTKIVKDNKDYFYVISDGAYYGALLFDIEYNFLGFYGANTVEGTILTTLQNLWDLLTKNDEKQSKEMKKLPYQFLDIALDGKDFAYTCTGITADESNLGQIRMLSPGGTNILDKNFGSSVVEATAFNFAELDVAKRRNEDVRQNFTGIQVDGDGFIYALDSTYGIIYVYDTDCNLLTAFGGGKDSGNREGIFSHAMAIEVFGGKVFVADDKLNNITVFEKTEFGAKLLGAQCLTLDGEYIKAKHLWNEVIALDANCRPALSALGKAAYSEGDYKLAMEYSKQAVDRTTYDQAMKKNQEEFISDNFILIFLIVVCVLGLFAALIVVSRKKELVFIKNQKARLMATCCIHPFANFNDIKYKKMGSVPLATGLTAAFFVSAVINMLYTDFRFTSFDAVTYNPIYQLLSTVGLIFLWSGANWAVSVLQQGKGHFKEVYIVTAYAMFPMICSNILCTVCSHFINSTSAVVISGINLVALILSGIILVIGTMIIHEFSFPRFVFTAILTLFAMILIVFVIFMIGMLLSQLWQFVCTVVLEAVYR